jgi:HAE1 family hydrophobic/amphiphilic exporter-1
MLQAMILEFRPIIMITIAAAFGMWPLAVAMGLGSEMSVGIGMSSVGGIAVSGILTLIVIPAAYILIHQPKRDAPPVDGQIAVRRASSRLVRGED